MPRSRVDDDDDDRPVPKKRRVHDEADDRPVAKKRIVRDDNDDKRPVAKKRKKLDEDEDDDRPAVKKKRPTRELDDEDDGRPVSRRRRASEQDEEDYDDRPKRKKAKRNRPKEMSVVGLISLIIGVGSFVLSVVPCIGSIALYPGILGVLIGFVALVLAQKSDGRQGMGLPISGLSVSGLAILIAVGWMILVKKVEKGLERADKEAAAERRIEVAKAANEVKAAQPGSVIRVSAAQFYQAYANDEDRADATYQNKVIEVTGTFKELDLAGDEGYILHLRGGRDEFETVDCNFAKDPAIRAQLVALTPGATITIRGKCLGGGSSLEACIVVN